MLLAPGNVFVADSDDNLVKELSAVDGSIPPFQARQSGLGALGLPKSPAWCGMKIQDARYVRIVFPIWTQGWSDRQ